MNMMISYQELVRTFPNSQLKKAGIDDDKKLEEWIDMANRVPNLQLLE